MPAPPMSGKRASLACIPVFWTAPKSFSRIEDPDDNNVIYMQNAEPISLYCNDTWDGESFRACHQVSGIACSILPRAALT